MIIRLAIFVIAIQLVIVLVALFDRDFRTKKTFFFWFGVAWVPLLPLAILVKREVDKLK